MQRPTDAVAADEVIAHMEQTRTMTPVTKDDAWTLVAEIQRLRSDAQPTRGDGAGIEELRAKLEEAVRSLLSETEESPAWIAHRSASFAADFLAAAPPVTSGETGLTTAGIASNCGGPLRLTSCPLLVDLAAWVDAGEDAADPIHAHLWEPNDGPGHPGCGSCQLAVLRFRDNPKVTS